jgi:hypothetical protein
MGFSEIVFSEGVIEFLVYIVYIAKKSLETLAIAGFLM